jgi:anhydro-N-acetylmuramic acid kinase
MVYRAIGLMSGSSLDGLDIVFAELNENAGKWNFEILASGCYSYSDEWQQKLKNAVELHARDYQLLHAAYGHYLGEQVNLFIEEHSLHYKVGMVASHGHTTFHMPAQKMTGQLGDGAAIAAVTGLPVISDLRALDVAFGGQGAPIVPIGEKLLFPQYLMFLNLGGIANISFNLGENYIAYDVCPANRVLNLIALQTGKDFDTGGEIAAGGKVDAELFRSLNELDYYQLPFPKSLANDFGTDEVYPIITSSGLSQQDAMRTYVEHIVFQIKNAVLQRPVSEVQGQKIMVTGGGAFNSYLIERLQQELSDLAVEVVVPEPGIVTNKEALIMALIGVLRWRNEYNVISTVTGARRSSIGGALWIGQEA